MRGGLGQDGTIVMVWLECAQLIAVESRSCDAFFGWKILS